MNNLDLEQEILNGRNSLSSDRLDMSFGELMSMYSNDELIINPEFQRLFRWNIHQRTRFIESLLLSIPIPSIFVAEDQEGKWEIVDGLQRLSTIFSFFGLLKHIPEKNGWILQSGDIVEKLDGLKMSDLPVKYQLNIKRAVCRIEIIKWDSKYDMRYELFNRLNTGGSPLTDQEIRNCIFRGVSADFTNIIKELSSVKEFVELIQPTQKQIDELYLDELVLRFFSIHENYNNINKNLSEHMTDYMKSASKSEIDYKHKIDIFRMIVKIIHPAGRNALSRKNGLFSTSLYDGIFNGVASNIDQYKDNIDALKEKIEFLKNDEEFKSASGTASNYKERVKKRIKRALQIFS